VLDFYERFSYLNWQFFDFNISGQGVFPARFCFTKETIEVLKVTL